MAKRNHSLPNLKPMLRYWPLAPIRSPVQTNCSDHSGPSLALLKQPAPTIGMKLLTCLDQLLLVLHCSSLLTFLLAILKPMAKRNHSLPRHSQISAKWSCWPKRIARSHPVDYSELHSFPTPIEPKVELKACSCSGWFQRGPDHSKRWSWLEKQTVKTTSYWHLQH